MKRCLKVLLLASGLVAAGSVMAQEAKEPEQRVCAVKAGEGLKVFDKCKAGDILVFDDFTTQIMSYVCDFSKQLTVTENPTSTNPYSCVYIGYVRKKI